MGIFFSQQAAPAGAVQPADVHYHYSEDPAEAAIATAPLTTQTTQTDAGKEAAPEVSTATPVSAVKRTARGGRTGTPGRGRGGRTGTPRGGARSATPRGGRGGRSSSTHTRVGTPLASNITKQRKAASARSPSSAADLEAMAHLHEQWLSISRNERETFVERVFSYFFIQEDSGLVSSVDRVAHVEGMIHNSPMCTAAQLRRFFAESGLDAHGVSKASLAHVLAEMVVSFEKSKKEEEKKERKQKGRG